MTLLIFLEAPLAAVFIVAYLGPAVFLEKRTIRQVAGDVLRQALPLLLLPGPAPRHARRLGACICSPIAIGSQRLDRRLLHDRALRSGHAAMRAFRPYINEIILLEKNPLSRGNPSDHRSASAARTCTGPIRAISWSAGSALRRLPLLLVGLVIYTAVADPGRADHRLAVARLAGRRRRGLEPRLVQAAGRLSRAACGWSWLSWRSCGF